MPMQKKHGKGRLDKWYKLAKEKGYRARAAFKLIQLNKKYGFLEKSKVVLDLCAAPGSWSQVAAETMPVGSLIVAVDLAPIKAIPRVISFQSDITTDKCRATIRQHLKTWKADTVLHDGAPNVGTAWVQDAFTQAQLVLQSMKLATEFLCEGGTFVTKVFRSKDYNSLLWVFNQLFTKVEATKPPSSRNVSAEIFVVCRGYKAPKRIDPKFLDARAVFAELADPTPNNEAKVYNPAVKKRKRDGYVEGEYTQFKEIPASDFIQTTDPIAILGTTNKLSFAQQSNGDIAQAALDKLPETTDEIRVACADLKVLGRKEFRALLRWRLKAREKFGFPTKKSAAIDAAALSEEVVAVEPMDEELQIQEDLQKLKDREDSRKKRARRRENEQKQRETVRMQLHMTMPTDIGLEQGGLSGVESTFQLKDVDRAGAVNRLAKGKMSVLEDRAAVEDDRVSQSESDPESDPEADALERELDAQYDEYQTRKSEADTKYRARKARKEHEDGDWEGIQDEEQSSDEEILQDPESDGASDDEADTESKLLVKGFEASGPQEDGLTRRAAQFFDQDIFKEIGGLDVDDDGKLAKVESPVAVTDDASKTTGSKAPITIETSASQTKKSKVGSHKTDDDMEEGDGAQDEQSSDEDTGFEVVKTVENDGFSGEHEEPRKDGRLNIDIITAEAMSLAQQIATGKVKTKDLVDDGFNRFAFRDVNGLPEWFIDEEGKHSRQNRPITAAGAAAIKAKLRALNARPIKKVREAKDRKKFKAAQRLEKLRKKSALLADEDGTTEKDKAQSIAKLMSKAAKKKPHQPVKLVVARGGNRGISGRPRGVKGRYKIVDARLKKDVRAEKRLKKARK